MRRLRCGVLAGVVACCLMALSVPKVYAAQEGGEESPLTSVFQWINFGILAGLLGWVLVKKAPPFFAAQAAQISSAIEEAGKVKAQADAQRAEAEQRLANLATEIEQLREAARGDAAAEVERIRAGAKEEATKIHSAAQMEVDAAARGARMELRALATRLSIERAEAVLRKEMTPAADEGMFAVFLGELERPRGQAGRSN